MQLISVLKLVCIQAYNKTRVQPLSVTTMVPLELPEADVVV